MIVRTLMRMNFMIFIADWTEKSFRNLYANIDAAILSERNPYKSLQENTKSNEEKEEEEEEAEEEKEDENETFDNSAALSTTQLLPASYLLITCGPNFVLHQGLVPKGEGHGTFLPPLTNVIEANMKECDTQKTMFQVRTDGIGNHKYAAKKVIETLEERYFDPNTGKSILKPENKEWHYDIAEWKDGDWAVV